MQLTNLAAAGLIAALAVAQPPRRRSGWARFKKRPLWWRSIGPRCGPKV